MDKYTIPIEKLVINHKSRDWCLLSYPGHPKGCPNYGKHEECPPQVGLVEEVFNLDKPLYFCVVTFDIAAHMRKMKRLHEGWTDRQARNCLYWQSGVRSKLSLFAELEAYRRECNKVTLIPEAMGVHVIATAKNHDIPIDLKARTIVHKIALIGTSKSNLSNQLNLFPEVK